MVMGEGMEGDWCVLSQLGWIDEMGNENNETSTADLMSLKPEVLAELDESAMATCAEESRHDWQDDGEEAQEVRKEVLRGGQGRADGDGTEDPGVQLLQGDVPLRLPEECQGSDLRFLPGPGNGCCFNRCPNNKCPSYYNSCSNSNNHLVIVLTLMQEINLSSWTPFGCH